jgi:DNA polymerase III gamma/tau subunit
VNLSEKYSPSRIADFVGLEKPRRLLQNFATKPFGSAWLFVGRSGTGKTAMAHALAKEVAAQIHLLPANEFSRENVSRIWETCLRAPKQGT